MEDEQIRSVPFPEVGVLAGEVEFVGGGEFGEVAQQTGCGERGAVAREAVAGEAGACAQEVGEEGATRVGNVSAPDWSRRREGHSYSVGSVARNVCAVVVGS